MISQVESLNHFKGKFVESNDFVLRKSDVGRFAVLSSSASQNKMEAEN